MQLDRHERTAQVDISAGIVKMLLSSASSFFATLLRAHLNDGLHCVALNQNPPFWNDRKLFYCDETWCDDHSVCAASEIVYVHSYIIMKGNAHQVTILPKTSVHLKQNMNTH